MDCGELEAASSVNEVYIKRFKAKEVFPDLRNKSFHYPLAEGTLGQPIRDPEEMKRRKR